MKSIVKSLIIVGMIAPVALNAFGLGISVPLLTNVEHESNNRYGSWEEDKVSGFGFVLDSNVGKNRLYNYRLNIESTEVETEGGLKFDRLSFVNTFGFSLFRNKRVRVFAGPRLNIGVEERRDGDGAEVSIAPVVGVNVHLGSVVSLGFDIDYKISALSSSVGDYGYSYNRYYYDDYDEDLSGMMARFYVLFKLGERYKYADKLR